MSLYEAEGVIESAKEPAAELIQEIADIGVGEILRIAVEETAFGRFGRPPVSDDGRKHNRILKRHIKLCLKALASSDRCFRSSGINLDRSLPLCIRAMCGSARENAGISILMARSPAI